MGLLKKNLFQESNNNKKDIMRKGWLIEVSLLLIDWVFILGFD